MNSLIGGVSLKKIYNKIISLFIIFTLLLGSGGPAVSYVIAESNGIETEELELEAEQASEAEVESEAEAESESESESESKHKAPEKTSDKELEELKEEDKKTQETKEPESVEEEKEDESSPSKTDEVDDDTEEEVQEEVTESAEVEEDEEDEEELLENIPAMFTPAIPIPAMGKMKLSGGLVDTIEVNKTATRTPGCRTFEVKLDITGERQDAPVDVVLVIDRSGSMNDRAGGTFWAPLSRLYYAKQAAVNFAGKVLGPNGIPGSRVSLVTFNGPSQFNVIGSISNSTINEDLTGNLTTITNKINGITAEYGTNTQAGFQRGQEVIQGTKSLQNPNSNKVVIMFTDGMPTASDRAGAGPNAPTAHNAHTRAAYEAGQTIYQNNIADVFTIGLLQGMSGTVKNIAVETLTWAQNKGFYEAPTAQDLEDIFSDISTQLGYSATQAKVVDKIGDNFDLVESSLPAGATYNSDTREITWNPGTIYESAQLKYTVVAKPDFPGGLADTNEYAKLTYKDIFGDNQTKDFPVPEVVVPTLIEVSLTDATINLGDSINLGSGTDENGENYMSPVTGGDNDGTTFTYEWRKVGDDTVISNDKNPSVSPTEDTQYELTVIDSNGCIAKATMWVRVISLTDVTVKKTVTGNMGDMEGSFSFTVEVEGEDEPREFVLSHGKSHPLEEIPINAQLTLTEIDSRGHVVTVTINNTPISAQDDKFIIGLSEFTGEAITIEVTNYKNILIDTGVTLDSLVYILILLGAVFGLAIKVIPKKNYE